MVLPLTFTFPQLGSLGKGNALLISATDWGASLSVRVLGMVITYSAVGLRDPGVNDELGRALLKTPAPRLERLQRDRDDVGPACWFYQGSFCFSEANA